MTVMTMAKAINEGLRVALAGDEKVILMGEDIGRLGGVFRVTEGLQVEFGTNRVLDTPLAESGIIGTAIGLAMRGYRPVCEIQFDGFIFPAFDQITTQIARLLGPIACSISRSSILSVPSRMSTKTGRAPRSNTATASGATESDALTQAQTTACGPIIAGMNESIACGKAIPVAQSCKPL